ncbi:MAG: LL-diaminopimelate aminotransferase [Candidatus Curtissbacteria bacterium]|nr:LL-diaminopimelate aminotransferase [Candidatus Curtissbacteria bacterium]
MATINTNFDKLAAGYLFSEIARRTKEFANKNPDIEILRLGIGNTTEPLVPAVINGLAKGVEKLSRVETYSGYGDEQGNLLLRETLGKWYQKRKVFLDPGEIFISDGAKSDSANIQSLFSKDSVIAVCDPVYPVYVDSNVIAGRTGEFSGGKYKGLVYLPCNEENGFFPDLPKRKVDLIYICSPNNPTGAVATKKQLKNFVDFAVKTKAVIVFDAAYFAYISDPKLPRSVYEVPGAKECAIEINSFSKWAGFCGVRLGWTVVPMGLVCKNSPQGKLNMLWNRRQTTMFNGASNIAQEGGLAVLSPKGVSQSQKVVDYYMGNARMIKKTLSKMGLKSFGGDNAPYIWLKTPGNMKSWDFFDKLLLEAHVVGIPGSGFGFSGEGYLRLSAFGHRENIQKAVESIYQNLKI